MNYRLSTLFAEKSYAANATEVIDISIVDPISALIIEHDVLNGAVGSMTAHPLACITKIEMVDGSDVLFSLNGRQADAVDWYQEGHVRSPWHMTLTGNYHQSFIGLNFGRKMWDPVLAFLPKEFKNPQLKITLDIDGGGLNPTTNKLKVWAALFDEKMVAPMGFLMHKEIKDYSLSSSGHEYTDLPTDHPYRKLFVRQQSEGYEPCQVLANFKLSEEFDKKIVIDHATEDVLRTIASRLPPYDEHWYFQMGTSNRYLMCTPTVRTAAFGNPWLTTAGANYLAFYDGDGGRLKTITSTGEQQAQILVRGDLPHGVWEIPFGDQDDPDDWFDVTKIGSLRLDILAAAYSASTPSAQIFLQQLRKY